MTDSMQQSGSQLTEKATFAAGCFWGVEAAFRATPGVKATQVGYTGGWQEDPSYRDVCRGNTGHAEAVEVDYDPTQISFENLLDIFWAEHDPTTKNRQGPDIGAQYRSAIFFHDADQKEAALKSIQSLNESGRYKRPIVTELAPAGPFFPAEDYHQRYLEKRGLATCRI